jgi:hypothetical protein
MERRGEVMHWEIVQKLSDFSAFLSCNKLKSEKVKKAELGHAGQMIKKCKSHKSCIS